jgi:hypothetical protein
VIHFDLTTALSIAGIVACLMGMAFIGGHLCGSRAVFHDLEEVDELVRRARNNNNGGTNA